MVGGRLIPPLAELAELLPRLKQGHNQPDPAMGERMEGYFDGFVQDEARAMGVTGAEWRAWRPQAPVRGRRRRTQPRLSERPSTLLSVTEGKILS